VTWQRIERRMEPNLDKAGSAVSKNIERLTSAISVSEPTLRSVVLACQQEGLITSDNSKALLDTFIGKSTQARATDLINCIQGLVSYTPEYLDDFLRILVVKGGRLGGEVARSVASLVSPNKQELPKYDGAIAPVESILGDEKNNAEIMTDSEATCNPATTKLSVAELLEPPYNINLECLRKKFTDDLLVLLALEGQQPQDVARYFNMEDCCTVNQLEEKSENGQIVSILSTWKERKGNDATYLNLIVILIQNNCPEIAKSIAFSVQRKYNIVCNSVNAANGSFRLEKSYSNWNDFDENHKERIRNSLRDQNNEIIGCFNETFLNILKSFRERNVDPDELKMCLKLQLKKIKYDDSKLQQINKVVKIFDFIDDIGCDWLNYHLLDFMTSIHGNDKDKQSMISYVKKLWVYLQRSLYRIPPESFGPLKKFPDHAYHFVLPVQDGDDISGQQLIQIQLMLAKKLEIPSHIQMEIKPGSIIIYFFVNNEIFTNDDARLKDFTRNLQNDSTYYINVNWLQCM
jgi:hypothetical protein